MDKEQIEQKAATLAALDSRFRELQQALALLEQQINELQLVQLSLDELGATKPGTSMLAQLGPGVYVSASLADNKEVLLNAGAKVLCKKSTEEARKLLAERLERMLELHGRLMAELQGLAQELTAREQELRQQAKIE